MEKLSSILASSPRVKSVDLSNAHPVRPGAPAFGAPVGSAVGDRLSLSPEGKDMALREAMAQQGPHINSRNQLAKELTRAYFENRLKTDQFEPMAAAEAGVIDTAEEFSGRAPTTGTAVPASEPKGSRVKPPMDIEA
ncbi:MAG: hypothetical protein C5B49_12895 [Bdellovibrio sp.]|nr:MAG: hypothetical protein C5B49_12895 [Bdellovibrio sp.]